MSTLSLRHHPLSLHYSPQLSWSPAGLSKQHLHHAPLPIRSDYVNCVILLLLVAQWCPSHSEGNRKAFLRSGPHYIFGLTSHHSPFLSLCSNHVSLPLCLQHGKQVPVSRHFLLLFLLLLLPLPPGRKISQMSARSPPQFSQVFPLSVYP